MSFATTSLAALGPLFLTVIVHSTMSLTFTSDALTDLTTSRSQIGSATVVLFALLFDSLESGVVELTTTTLVKVPLVKTLVTKTRETGESVSNSPISQILDFSSKLPADGAALMIAKPSGKISLTTTSIAVDGPLLTTVIVHSTLSLTLTREAFTNLVISKSQIGSATVVLFALLLDSLESGVELFTTTMLVMFPSRVTIVINSKAAL